MSLFIIIYNPTAYDEISADNIGLYREDGLMLVKTLLKLRLKGYEI